jgi:proteasome lid subunit RPN8/RPN11
VLLGHFEGEANSVAAVVSCANASQDSPRNRYSIAPLDLVRIQRDARTQGLDIIGFYHSHPDHPPQWSATDLEEAHWLGCSYLIISVTDGKATETRSFRLLGAPEQSSPDQKRFLEESIHALD